MIEPLGACLSLIAAVAVIALSGVVVAEAIGRIDRRGAAPTVTGALGDGALDRWLVCFGLGAAGWIALLFALACVGLLTTVPIAILASLLPASGLALELRRSARRPHDPGRRPEASPRHAVASAVAIAGASLAIAATVLALAARAVIPDVSWDADVYHLTVPRIYLEHGGFVRIPFNVFSNWPLGVELLFAAAMTLDDFVLAKLLHLAFGVATALACWRLAAAGAPGISGSPTSGSPTSGSPAGRGEASAPRVAAAGAGVVAAMLFLANPVVLAEMTVAYVDLASAFFLLLGFAAIHRALQASTPGVSANAAQRLPPATRSALVIAGISAGALCAVKVTGFLAAGSLAALLVLEAWRARWPVRRLVRGLLVLALPALLLLLPWPLKSWILTGNPVYPFLHEIFGGPESSAALAEGLARWQRAIGMGREPVDYLLLPLRVALEGGDGYARFDGRISPLWLVLVPLSVWAAWRDALVRRATVLAGLSFALWAATSQQMRFLVPVLALLAVAAARALGEAIRALRLRPERARIAATATVLLATALLLSLAWPWVRVALDNLPALTRHYPQLRSALIDPAHRFVNERLPPDARLLMLDHNRAFFVERDYVADSFLEASQIGELFRGDDAQAAAQRLERMGITHVLREHRRPGASYPDGLLEAVAKAPLLYRSPDGRMELRELSDRGPRVLP